MRRIAQWLGWLSLFAGVLLLLLGLATWPPGGLMFALPFVFIWPGAVLVLIGAVLAWAGRSPGRGSDPGGPTSSCRAAGSSPPPPDSGG